MLLDAETLDLAPVGPRVIEAAGAGAPIKLEMPAAQLECDAGPAGRVADVIAVLGERRRAVAAAAEAVGVRVACMAAHPFAAAEGILNAGARYETLEHGYGLAARRQLLGSLHVHVRVSGAERALAVHNALRSHLPDLAAVAACAPYYEGRDTGLASVRPLIAALLPRQGIPPVIASFEDLAEGLRIAGDPAAWWWELRPHRIHGTIELRVPDGQASLAAASAVAGLAHALVGWLAERHDAGEPLSAHETWRIDQNRWSALRHGPAGTMTDLDTGEQEATSERLARLIEHVGPVAERLGCSEEVRAAGALLEDGGQSARLREAAGGNPRAAAEHVAGRFLDGISA